MKLLLLVLCLSVTGSAQSPEHMGITVPAEGSFSLSCGSNATDPIPLLLNLQLEGYNESLVAVWSSPMVLMLDTYVPSLLLNLRDKEAASANYSCSVGDVASSVYVIRHAEESKLPGPRSLQKRYPAGEVMKLWTNWRSKGMSPEGATNNNSNNVTYFESAEMEWIACRVPENWTRLQWSRGDELIASVHRLETWLNIVMNRNRSSLTIHSLIEDVAGSPSCDDEPEIKILNVTCQWLPLPSNPNGWQLFLQDRYWIIVVVSLSSALFCLALMGCFVSMKRRQRVRRQAKSRFFKVSTATKNLYTDSINQETDIDHKDQEFTYQNVSLPGPKATDDDCYSDKSSFLSVGADSYLEPTPEGGDRVSDGSCYENPTDEGDDYEGSIDGDCYENASEEMKNGSEGSQSYEDMKGSVCIRTKTEAPPDEGIAQDEDADSYENMQTPLYSQTNRFFNPQHKSTEDQSEGRKASLADPRTNQPPWKVSTELQGQNGDFYLSYDTKKQ